MQPNQTENHVESHPFAFLQKTTSDPKLKFRVRLEELREVLDRESLLTKMNDRALFVVVITELLGYQFGIFQLRVKALHGEVCRSYKPFKKREDRENQPPKRNRKARVNASGVDIQNIANESVSNPSHLQAERRVEVESRDDSKGSKPSNPQS